MGRKARAKLVEAKFGALIDATDRLTPDEQETVALASHVRDNLRLSLEERRTAQQIKESKRRLQTDEELLDLIHTEVIARHFVLRDEERERVRGLLLKIDCPFSDMLAEYLFPSSEGVKGYVKGVLEAYARRHGTR